MEVELDLRRRLNCLRKPCSEEEISKKLGAAKCQDLVKVHNLIQTCQRKACLQTAKKNYNLKKAFLSPIQQKKSRQPNVKKKKKSQHLNKLK